MVTSDVLVSKSAFCGSSGETKEKAYVALTRTTHPAELEGVEEDDRHEAPVASVPGQLTLTLRLDFTTPPGASDCTKEVTVLLLAVQPDEVYEEQEEDHEAPRTMAYRAPSCATLARKWSTYTAREHSRMPKSNVNRTIAETANSTTALPDSSCTCPQIRSSKGTF